MLQAYGATISSLNHPAQKIPDSREMCRRTSSFCAAACQRMVLSADYSLALPHVQARLGCAAVLAHAACFSAKPLRMFAEVLKVKEADQPLHDASAFVWCPACCVFVGTPLMKRLQSNCK